MRITLLGTGSPIPDARRAGPSTLVTADANGLELDATLVGLSASHKSRGLGDCWGHQSWVWDGRQFVHPAPLGHGLCRGFPGGAWDMPTRVVEVLKDHSR